MRSQPYKPTKTWISIINDALAEWCARDNLSMQTVVDKIVEQHERIGAVSRTGIIFEQGTRDQFHRMRINGERVMRWLDERDKGNNMLGLNFTESILSALPDDLRLACVNQMLVRHCGLTAHVAERGVDALRVQEMLRAVLKETGEAEAAMVDLFDGQTHEELLNNLQQSSEAIAALEQFRKSIEVEVAKQPGSVSKPLTSIPGGKAR